MHQKHKRETIISYSSIDNIEAMQNMDARETGNEAQQKERRIRNVMHQSKVELQHTNISASM